ncbi:DMT family transporter [Marinobacterium jannaschii]|uniref:DMT family transporter n=1 Tax=Marinobacterium jannaschii TaxID=64970 RepID=UPI000684912E|nr:DMT family transporter [Marinobacterium jannaschii]
MFNFALYLVTVLIWGTTWIAIKLQLGDIAVEASILYRFSLAALVMVLALTLLRRWQPLQLRDHLFCVLQGGCLFCFNFYCFYTATGYISSGLASVIFSLATIANAVNGWWIYGNRPGIRVVAGSLVGVAGVIAMFWPEITADQLDAQVVQGAGLAALGTLLFSFGNMVSIRQRRQRIAVEVANGWSMLYGVLMLLLIGGLQGVEYRFDSSTAYVASLLYLAIPGTVIAFTTYLMLVARIGPDKAAYSTVMFPAIALSVSTVYEGFIWHQAAILGFVLVLCGNLLIFARMPKAVIAVIRQWLHGRRFARGLIRRGS